MGMVIGRPFTVYNFDPVCLQPGNDRGEPAVNLVTDKPVEFEK